MMETIIKSITINATPENVWRVFTDPVVTQRMGGEYISDWEEGSKIEWKALNGTIYTHGIILKIEPGKTIKHSLVDMNDKSRLLSTVSYEFVNNMDNVVLNATEELNYEVTEQELQEISEGWDAALRSVKELAETL